MPFLISWDNASKTIVRVTVTGDWSIEDFRAMLIDLVSTLRSVSHPVYILADARESALPPLGIVWNARFAFQWLPGNYSGGIVVTQNAFLINVVDTVSVLYFKQSPLIAVRTLKEARETIMQWIGEGV